MEFTELFDLLAIKSTYLVHDQRVLMDGTFAHVKRIKSLKKQYFREVGGEQASPGELALIDNICSLQVALEAKAEALAKKNGNASLRDLESYAKAAGIAEATERQAIQDQSGEAKRTEQQDQSTERHAQP